MLNMALDGQDSERMMSKTQHYRKVTKPLLERKRRARMNHYLDELKDLIIETMESQGEHITKLEKADILEMTVTYLREKSLKRKSVETANLNKSSKINNNIGSKPTINTEKFRAGYTQAAYEVSKVFASIPGIDVHFGTKLMKHLGYKLKDLKPPQSLELKPSFTSSSSDQLSDCEKKHINALVLPPVRSPLPSPSEKNLFNQDLQQEQANENVWRPW